MDYEEFEAYRSGKKRRFDGGNSHFEWLTEPDLVETERTGLPKVRTKAVLIVHPIGGDVTPIDVDDSIKREYAREWAAFEAKEAPPTDGFPLSEWAMMPKATVEELKFYGIKTIENLVQAPDNMRQRLGPLADWIKRAKVWKDAENDPQVQVAALSEKLDTLISKMKKTQEENLLLRQRIDSLEGNGMADETTPPKRGRPTKHLADDDNGSTGRNL